MLSEEDDVDSYGGGQAYTFEEDLEGEEIDQ